MHTGTESELHAGTAEGNMPRTGDLLRLARRFHPLEKDAVRLVERTLLIARRECQWPYIFSVMHQLFLEDCKEGAVRK